MKALPALLAIPALLLLLFVAAEVMKQQSMFYPIRFPGGSWNIEGDPRPSDLTFQTSDGVRLHSWFFRAAEEDAPLLIWFHGNGGNITHRADVATELARRGTSVFLFDWRGYGKSEGAPTERALFRDSLAAYDFATQQAPSAKVVLYGESLGGPYAAFVSRKRATCAVVIENSFPSLSAIANHLFRPIPAGFFFRSLRTSDWLNESRVPVLVMHGKRDAVIPYELGIDIYQSLHGTRELFVSERAEHSAIPEVEGDRYYDTVISFVRNHCRR